MSATVAQHGDDSTHGACVCIALMDGEPEAAYREKRKAKLESAQAHFLP